MKAHIGSALIALALLAAPLFADLTGITTTPANLPSAPNEMTVGGGYLWILTQSGNLGRMSPGGAYVEYPLQFGKNQFGNTNASNMAFGFDGNVWVSGQNGHVERITPSGTVTDFAGVPGILNQSDIVSGADDAMWFFDVPQFGSTSDNNSKIARIDIYGQVTTYPLGLGTDFFGGLVSGGDGNLWFVDSAKNAVEKFSIITKSVTAYTIPTNQNGGGDIVLGPDGNVWFTHGKGIDRVTSDGKITEFPIPSGGQPSKLAVAGDGNIWFTEYSAGKIGQLVVSSVTSGGSATINESAAILPNDEDIILLPPGFIGSSGKTALGTKPCPVITFIVKITPPTGGTYVSTTVPKSACADISASIQMSGNSTGTEIGVSILVQNSLDYPDPADQVTAIVKLNTSLGGTSGTIVGVQSSDPAVTWNIVGLTVTFTRPSLVPGASFFAGFFLSQGSGSKQPVTFASGTVIAFSATPDPNPINNVNSVWVDSSTGHHVSLPPDVSDVVITPVNRGK